MNCRENLFIFNPSPPPTQEGSFRGHNFKVIRQASSLKKYLGNAIMLRDTANIPGKPGNQREGGRGKGGREGGGGGGNLSEAE